MAGDDEKGGFRCAIAANWLDIGEKRERV